MLGAFVAISLALVGGVGAAHRAASIDALTFCTDPTFPPMEMAKSNGTIFGFDVEMAAAIGTNLGISSKPVKTAFPGLIPALNSKRCEVVISGIFVTPDRLKQAGAVTYMHTHRALLVKGGNPKKITGPSGLKGKNVAVQAGTKYEEYLKALQKKIGFNLQSYPGDTDAVAQVLLGRADAVLTQDTSAAYQIGQHKGKIQIGYLFPQKDAFGIYYRKGEAATTGADLKSAIAALKQDGTMKKLATKYNLPVADVK
jgi:polar amino acid transport system substrate-binding protein